MGAAARPLDEGPHPVILYERNRSFAEGRKGRLPLHDCVVSTFLTAGCSCFCFFMAFILWSTGPSWSLMDVLGTVMVLMLVGLRAHARSGCALMV